jgi:hypothetical protein
MKPTSHPEQLLDDILVGSATTEFRARLLEEMLQQVRHCRRARRRRRAFAALALCLSAVFLVWQARQPGTPSSVPLITSTQVRPSMLVYSQPLPAAMIVESRAGSVDTVTSASGALVVIDTPADQRFFSEIGDAELFSLLAGRPVVLIQEPGNTAELVFLNPADRAGFPVP